ncbi:RNA polymerase subunit sigma-24 [Fulvitalea axinellae]|uniref:RNA polymerase subunit sigma-24 n=1 Tax=Fulvitalea axinellae TaxID=1182444 RepID=A0AAU9CDF6_9BACT|nr:RNA polymerase subunit sigma-24 [Fulvitalea axinellae]
MDGTDIEIEINHLFRKESGKMVSVLAGIFGTENYELAEDVVQDALLSAMESWKIRGLPDNPRAWLYKTAKNRAVDILRKEKRNTTIDFSDPERKPLITGYALSEAMEHRWSDERINDDFLGMMYACCHPEISEENQKTFILKSLCGFSSKEIAKAFLTNEQTISKRLYRTKSFFRTTKIKPEVPAEAEIAPRTRAVLEVIYLIFNEGYNSTQSDHLIRKDLVSQAMFLCRSLIDNTKTHLSEAYALMALMCLHTSRTPGRVSETGDIIPMEKQDRKKWNKELINAGIDYLVKSAIGESASNYHLEAAIAYEYCTAKSYESTNWKNILRYYNMLYKQTPDPVILLNRCIVLMEHKGAEEAMKDLQKLKNERSIEKYYLYHAIAGEIHSRLGEKETAVSHLKKAKELTHSAKEKRFITEKISMICTTT